jgi:hypothetical protein
MLEQLASVPAAQRLYKQQGGTVKRDRGSEQLVQWRPQEVRQHLRHIQRFLELLSLAVHIAGGQPARGLELLSVQ